jgi:hypothetical protein
MSVPRWLFLVLTVVVAASVGIIVGERQRDASTALLLQSTSSTDRLAGVSRLDAEQLDLAGALPLLAPLLADADPQVVDRAAEALVRAAAASGDLERLGDLAQSHPLFGSAVWWASRADDVSRDVTPYVQIAGDPDIEPWMRRLASLHCDTLSDSCADELVALPPRDRDGSVAMAVLAVQRHGRDDMLIEAWLRSPDVDKREAATLLAAMQGENVASLSAAAEQESNPSVRTLMLVCGGADSAAALRTLHDPDGLIDPDHALAALCVDREVFLPLVIKTARENRWSCPEHAVELARHFAPRATGGIPTLMALENRDRWWSLVACGLLLEDR